MALFIAPRRDRPGPCSIRNTRLWCRHRPIALPMSYAMARGDRELVDYVNALVELKKGDGTLKKLYNYWVLGQFAVDTQPRWSVIRNVLHWVD